MRVSAPCVCVAYMYECVYLITKCAAMLLTIRKKRYNLYYNLQYNL